MKRPVALACGDPAGVGPEIALKAWEHLTRDDPFVLIGDLEHCAELGHALDRTVIEVASAEAAADAFENGVPVLNVACLRRAVSGSPDPANAPSVVEAIRVAVECWKSGAASAVCTNPVSKHVLKTGAGFPHPGQTEFLAALAGANHGVMMLCNSELRVVPVTVHIPVAEITRKLTAAIIERAIRVTDHALRSDFGIENPRISVAGLNPHAGENGMMGTEDIEVIQPVVARLADEGMALQGPLAADSMFHAEARATYDAAVCMFHDQALIPVKTIGMAETVNVTLGLPFVRTSPGHGTAFDIAGQNRASERSLVEALKLARRLAENRDKRREPRDG